MRLLRFLPLLLCLCLWAIPAHAQTYQANASGTCSASVSSCSTSGTLNATVGETIYVFVKYNGPVSCPDTNPSISDTAGNTFTASLTCIENGAQGDNVQAYVGSVTIANASDTVKVTYGTTNQAFTGIVALLYSGVASASPVYDATISYQGSSTSGTFSTTQASEVIINCAAGDSGTSSWSAGLIGGTTANLRFNSTTTIDFACQDLSVTSTQSSITAGIVNTGGNAVNISGTVISLKALTAAAPVITQSNPAVNQGTTLQFTETLSQAGTWSCAGTTSTGSATTCAGSITTGGLYTAPSSVTAQQSVGGYQLLPNNHIFNTNISAFPLRSDSATLIAGLGSTTVTMMTQAKPVNYVNGSTPTAAQVFFYTSPNNGTYQIPAYPGVWPTEQRIEGGALSAQNNADSDHHLLTIDTTSGNMQDMYQLYPAGDGTGEGCPTCTSQSGLKYTNSTYTLPVNGSTDAAGMFLTPLILRLQEVEQAIATGGTINHALRMTMGNSFLHNAFLWPATTSANEGSGANYYGERIRLKSTFVITGYSATAQIFLKEMQQYGLYIADGGISWALDLEYTKWPTSIQNALNAVGVGAIGASNFDVVDESGFEITSTSGECTCNRETITFTRTSDSETASTDVVLTGVAVNLPYDLMQIQVGAPAQTLTALVNIGAVTWTMSPTVGTLNSSTGLYTPPGSESVPSSTTVTATSTTNSSVAASMTVVVFPAGVIRLVPGSAPGTYNYTMVPTTYTDSSSHAWYSIGDDGGYASAESLPSVSGTSDPTLYGWPYNGYLGDNDERYDFIVPNGTYSVLFQAATYETMSGTLETLELNGTNVNSNLDLYVASGGQWVAYNYTAPNAVVTNNKLSFVTRMVGTVGPNLGSLQITQTALTAGSSAANAVLKNGVIQ